MARHRALKLRRYAVMLVLGELLITSGIVLGAYVAYELWGSNVAAKQTWTSSTSELQSEFEQKYKALLEANPSVSPAEIKLSEKPKSGKPFALLYAPSLWPNNKSVPILEDTSDRVLAKGIGHYTETNLPGEVGNFAIAGHRATHGEPFAQFQLFKRGDKVTVETLAGKYVYALVADIKVLPEDVWVIGPKPAVEALNSYPADAKFITLTTCDPRWSSEKRWVWFGVQESFTPRAQLGTTKP
jgi:sortase A